MARSESRGLMCSWRRMLALLCLLTFLCFSHSSSVLQPVLLKTELVEKGFTLWEGRKNSEWMYPWKVTAIYSAVQRASQAKSPSVSLVQRTPQKHTQFFLGRHFLHPSASSETQLQQSQLLPFPVCAEELCEVISHSRHWLIMFTHSSQTLTNVFSHIPPHQVQWKYNTLAIISLSCWKFSEDLLLE